MVIGCTGWLITAHLHRQGGTMAVMANDLTEDQLNRAAGVLVAQACGDALGVPYEFGNLALTSPPHMVGGGLGCYRPGEWSDDTQMSLVIAAICETGADLTDEGVLDQIAAGFEAWFQAGPGDVGAQTSAVLSSARLGQGRPAARLREAASDLQARTGKTAGNGALMRTSVVGLSRLNDRQYTATAAAKIAQLTHADPLAAESCILWSEAVRVAVTTGILDVAGGLDLLPLDRRPQWAERITEAMAGPDPASFPNNGFTVTALQAALASVVIGSHAADPVLVGLETAVTALPDTDTVAAIAGGLLGGLYGRTAIPERWQQAILGWPGAPAVEDYTADDLAKAGVATATKGVGAASV